MKNREFKLYTMKIEEIDNVSLGSSDGWQGDYLSTAANIAMVSGAQQSPDEAKCTLLEYWHHKVGRSWKAEEKAVGTWTLGELRVAKVL